MMKVTPDAVSITLKRNFPINLQEKIKLQSTRRVITSVSHDTIVNVGLSSNDWQKVFRFMFSPGKYTMPDLPDMINKLVAAKKLIEKFSDQPAGKPADKLYTWSSMSTIHICLPCLPSFYLACYSLLAVFRCQDGRSKVCRRNRVEFVGKKVMEFLLFLPCFLHLLFLSHYLQKKTTTGAVKNQCLCADHLQHQVSVLCGFFLYASNRMMCAQQPHRGKQGQGHNNCLH